MTDDRFARMRFTVDLPAQLVALLDDHCAELQRAASRIIGVRTEVSRNKAVEGILRAALGSSEEEVQDELDAELEP
jgi:metal-responsive CopG/Arc/MetJ family transcriptional regulator